MTRTQAFTAAIKLADRTGAMAYLVYESGEWDAATAYDLETFYAGTEPSEAIPPETKQGRVWPAFGQDWR